jgi:hypothetical protein
MRKIFFVFICLCLIPLQSCDDGDIITVELDFEDTFESCGEVNLVFYKTKDDPSESLSLAIKGVTLTQILDVDEDGLFEETYTISNSNPFNYRTYNNETLPSDLFCSDIPNSEVVITQDYESTSGKADITTILTEDDNDTVPSVLDVDPDKNDDTDGDGLLNFIDADDDGDNILTKDENPDPNGDGNLSDAQDTDDDGIPDYLDDDDDGDGVKTRDEENDSQDQNPANDITNSEVGPDYLNKDVTNTVPATAYREHSISRTFVIRLILRDIDIEILAADEYDFGTLAESNIPSADKSRKVTPDFN